MTLGAKAKFFSHGIIVVAQHCGNRCARGKLPSVVKANLSLLSWTLPSFPFDRLTSQQIKRKYVLVPRWRDEKKAEEQLSH